MTIASTTNKHKISGLSLLLKECYAPDLFVSPFVFIPAQVIVAAILGKRPIAATYEAPYPAPREDVFDIITA